MLTAYQVEKITAALRCWDRDAEFWPKGLMREEEVQLLTEIIRQKREEQAALAMERAS